MNIKNYTSSVPVDRSLANIERLLVRAGAVHFSKFYDENKELVGVLFQLPVHGIPMTFQLPAKPKVVEKVMLDGVKRPRRGTIQRIKEQAARTAWRLLEDWVHVQVSMIAMEQAEAIQIFLPYAYDGSETFFEKLKGNGFKQLKAAQGA